MQKLITKYGLAAHLALLAVAPLFLSPIPVLWISALVAFWIVMEPSRVGNEMLHGARSRVYRAIIHDPLFWVLLALVLVSGVRALNGGVATVYDAELGSWTVAAPHWPILPGTVAGDSALMHFAMSVVILVLITGCRHALGRSARFACALTCGGIVGVLLLAKIVVSGGNYSELRSLAVCAFEAPIYIGFAYGVLWLLALTSLVAVFERRWWGALPVQCFGLVGSLYAVFVYAPSYLSAMFFGVGLLVVLYGFVYLRFAVGKMADFKYLVVVGTSSVFAGMFAMVVLSPELLEAKIAPFVSHEFFTQSFFDTRNALSRLSLAIWKEHPWLGTGLDSFAIDLNFNATEADWRVISPLQTAPLNGFWLLLVERGVIGAFFVCVPVVMLAITYIQRLVSSIRSLPHPLAVLAPILLMINVAAMLVDCTALSPAVLVLTFMTFTLSANSFSKKEGQNG